MKTLLQSARATLLPVAIEELFTVVHAFMQDAEQLDSIHTYLEQHTVLQPNTKCVHLTMTAIVLHIRAEALIDAPSTDTPLHHTYVTLLQATEEFVETLSLCEVSSNARTVIAMRLRRFQQAFVHWQTVDRRVVLQQLAVAWVDIECTTTVTKLPNTPTLYKELEQRASSVGATPQQLQRYVANHRACIISQQAVQYALCIVNGLNNSASPAQDKGHPTNKATPAFEQSVDAVVKKAFWDAFVARLDKKHTDQLALLLNEVKHKLNALTPSRTDMHQTIDRAIDTSLIVQMVQHDCLDANHFLKVTSFVIEHIQATQAPAHTTATQEWYGKWRSRFLSGELTFARLCAQFLARAHEDIDRTQEVCQRICASNSRHVSK